MKKSVHKELPTLVLEGRRWEREVGGPFHGPIKTSSAEGVLEEERDVEGSDATRREIPSSERVAKPLACGYKRTLAQLLAQAQTRVNVTP
jgi:hypothetical protein